MSANIVYYLYKISHKLYSWKIPFLPSLIKGIIRIVFGAVISPKTKIGKNVLLGYNGLGIVIHPRCIIGNNVVIGQQVTLGGRGGPDVPVIGNNVFIGAGAKILGGVKVGDGAKIGANAVVVKDVPEGSTVIGIPGRIIEK